MTTQEDQANGNDGATAAADLPLQVANGSDTVDVENNEEPTQETVAVASDPEDPLVSPTSTVARYVNNHAEKKKPKLAYSDHRLLSLHPGESEVEQVARRIEKRRENRIEVTFRVRMRFLKTCQKVARDKGYDRSLISLQDLQDFRARVQEEVDRRMSAKAMFHDVVEMIGFHDESETLLKILERGERIVNAQQDDWFNYKDFNFYETVLVSRWPWLRSEIRVAGMIVFLFYFFTPILFCHILDDTGVCVKEPGKPYAGWMSSLYFASTTLSTVGYGDLSVTKDEGQWRVFFGALYMILSSIVAITAFSAAADTAFSPLYDIEDKIVNMMIGEPHEDELLPRRVARVRSIKFVEVTLEFLALNMIGVLVSRAFPGNLENNGDQWTWMTSIYWSIQTTSTIGYGDLNQSLEMRWFQIFYLTLSTYFVGSCLGKLGSMREIILEMRRQYAWKRRKVTKSLINDMQADNHDGRVDQFEFVLASLVTLGKVSFDDISPIMDKYRNMAGDKGFIAIDSAVFQQEENLDDSDIIEEEMQDANAFGLERSRSAYFLHHS